MLCCMGGGSRLGSGDAREFFVDLLQEGLAVKGPILPAQPQLLLHFLQSQVCLYKQLLQQRRVPAGPTDGGTACNSSLHLSPSERGQGEPQSSQADSWALALVPR